jgi:predicted DNA-binding transcriptional regulator AlpA
MSEAEVSELAPLLTDKDLARIFCTSRSTISRMIRDGRFPFTPIYVGKHARRYRVSDVRRYIDGGLS